MTADYFEFFGLPEKLAINSRNLEQRFHALSRKWHPDRFVRADEEMQAQALDFSAILNDGYRTLRDPVARTEYLLARKNITVGDGQKPPPELLEEVFELNMALEELKMGDTGGIGELRKAQTRFEEMLRQTDRDLEAGARSWDETGDPNDLELLRSLLHRRKYISNLVRETDKALAQHVSD